MSQRAYERAFADWLGVGHGFSFWKGRVALYAILKALGIREGDEVIVPGYTCVMAVNPIIYLGAVPVLLDIEPLSYNLDPALLAKHVTPRTKAIIAQHTYGYPADMDALCDIAQANGLAVIEDCCLALGSTYRGRTVGTIGQAAYFSFQWNKPYTSGLGGMAVTSDADLAAAIREICDRELCLPGAKRAGLLSVQLAVYRTCIYPRTTALAQAAFRWLTRKGIVVGSSTTEELVPTMPRDFFMAMSPLQARAGRRQLRKARRRIDHRRRLAEYYDQLLAERGFPVRHNPDHIDPVLVRYPVRVADKERALATASSRFVELGSWFESPLHPQETPLEAYGYRPGQCPEAERACRQVVNLPVHPRANFQTARRSVDFIAEIGPATD